MSILSFAAKRISVISFVILLTTFIMPIMPGLVYASSSSGSGSCSLPSRTFFGIPTWYEYLQGQPTPPTTGSTGSSTSCQPKFDSLSDVWLVVAAVIDMLLYVGGIGAVVMVIYGGVKFTTSMGSPEATASARKTIIYSITGLIIAISASFLVTFIAKSVGA